MTPDEQEQITRCARKVIAKLKREWLHLRSGERDEDMVNTAIVVAIDQVLPRYMPKSMGGTLEQFAWPRVHGALLEMAEATAQDWHASKEGLREMLSECKTRLDISDVELPGAEPDEEQQDRQARAAARVVDLQESDPDVWLVLQLEAAGMTCGELGREMGLHHNTIAWRRDRALERLRQDELLRDLYEERNGAADLDISYGHEPDPEPEPEAAPARVFLVEAPRALLSTAARFWLRPSLPSGCSSTLRRSAVRHPAPLLTPGLAPSRVVLGALLSRWPMGWGPARAAPAAPS